MKGKNLKQLLNDQKVKRVGCILLAAAVVIIVYLTNDTVKSQEDVEKYLQLSVLGTIPLMEMEKKSKKQKKGKGRKK